MADDDAAFSHRATMFEYVAASGWADPAEDEDRIAVARRSAPRRSTRSPAACTSTWSATRGPGVRRAYPPDKLRRLGELKAAYDPDNVTHLNASIQPSRS